MPGFRRCELRPRQPVAGNRDLVHDRPIAVPEGDSHGRCPGSPDPRDRLRPLSLPDSFMSRSMIAAGPRSAPCALALSRDRRLARPRLGESSGRRADARSHRAHRRPSQRPASRSGALSRTEHLKRALRTRSEGRQWFLRADEAWAGVAGHRFPALAPRRGRGMLGIDRRRQSGHWPSIDTSTRDNAPCGGALWPSSSTTPSFLPTTGSPRPRRSPAFSTCPGRSHRGPSPRCS